MNHQSDIDRVLSTWMADGPNAISDRVVDVVAVRIGVQRQRRPWPFPWRTNVTPIRLLAALAAALIVAVVGYSLLPRLPDAGGQASPASTSTPTPEPSVTVRDLPEGGLAAGRYRFQPLTDHPTLSVFAEIPAGWNGVPPWAVSGPVGTEGPNGIAIAIIRADGLFSDPCQWDRNGSGTFDQPGDIVVGPAAIDLANALAANPAYPARSAPSPVALDGYQGYLVEILLPTGEDLRTCDQDESGDARYFPFSGKDAGLYAQGNNNYWFVYILDVDGTRVIVVRLGYDETPAADIRAGIAIVDSLEFAP